MATIKSFTPPTVETSAWLHGWYKDMGTVKLVDEALQSYAHRAPGAERTDWEGRREAFVQERLFEASDHLFSPNGVYTRLAVTEALGSLALAFSLEVDEGGSIPVDCEFAALLHRLLTLELFRHVSHRKVRHSTKGVTR